MGLLFAKLLSLFSSEGKERTCCFLHYVVRCFVFWNTCREQILLMWFLLLFLSASKLVCVIVPVVVVFPISYGKDVVSSSVLRSKVMVLVFFWYSCFWSCLNFCHHKVICVRSVWLDSLMVSVLDPMIARSRVWLPANHLSSNNPGQVVHTPQLVNEMPAFRGPADQVIKSS